MTCLAYLDLDGRRIQCERFTGHYRGARVPAGFHRSSGVTWADGVDGSGHLPASAQPERDAPSGTTTQWGTRLRNGQIIAVDTEAHARAVRSATTMRREVGPWTEADA